MKTTLPPHEHRQAICPYCEGFTKQTRPLYEETWRCRGCGHEWKEPKKKPESVK
jgi:ribosomal protein L37AE/L43A